MTTPSQGSLPCKRGSRLYRIRIYRIEPTIPANIFSLSFLLSSIFSNYFLSSWPNNLLCLPFFLFFLSHSSIFSSLLGCIASQLLFLLSFFFSSSQLAYCSLTLFIALSFVQEFHSPLPYIDSLKGNFCNYPYHLLTLLAGQTVAAKKPCTQCPSANSIFQSVFGYSGDF